MAFPGRISALALSLVVTAAGILAFTASADIEECSTPDRVEYEICGDILEHWESNGAEASFGLPLTDELIERDPNTGEELIVQYFEYARLEFHPELSNTDYAVQSGRLGAELLNARGTDRRDWTRETDGESVFDVTGHAIAPEFEQFWNDNGVDLGDGAESSRESIALNGYPISPPKSVDDDRVELVQWFERTRLELTADGEVRAAAVGREATESSEQLSVRAEREITSLLHDVLKEHDTPGIGVWLESPEIGEFAWTPGEANPETGETYATGTHHRIGSITKPFVGEVILQLADEGVISLDDTVEAWFPELDGAEDITVRMLGNMTSGVFNYTEALAWMSELMDDPEATWEPDELLRFGFELTEELEPGAEWSYSNTNYVMLGLIIEDVTGNDLADELEYRIFEPLELTGTAFADSEDPSLPDPYARANTAMGLGASTRDSTDWNPSWAWAAGQIHSTPADMLRWAPDIYESSRISDEMRSERLDLVDVRPADIEEEIAGTEDPADLNIGYGFGILMTDGWYGHDGLIAGYASMVAYHPERDASLVIFSNADEIGSEGTLATGMAFDRITSIIEREFDSTNDR